jgi:hypothetical protein
LTISAWVYLTSYDAVDGSCIIAKSCTDIGAGPSDPFFLYGLFVGGNETVGFGVATGAAGSRVTVSSSATVSLNTWTFLCGTYDGTILKVYINGNADANTAGASLTVGSNTEPVLIGAAMWSGYWDVLGGKIDDIRVYNRALSNGEITNLYAWRGQP